MMKGVSVIIPSIRRGIGMEFSVMSVVRSLDLFSGSKELVLYVDRSQEENELNYCFLQRYPFVRLKFNSNPQGSPYVRYLGIVCAQYDVLLFTDDDCVVPINWVDKMYQKVKQYGVVTGNLRPACPTNIYSMFESRIDDIRMKTTTREGNIKFISFPNFGIQKELLPWPPFYTNSLNTAEDVDLSCRLRIKGIKIHFEETLFVTVQYPVFFSQIIRRKLKHAKGIVFLEKKYGPTKWRELEIGTRYFILWRWFRISFSAHFHLPIKALFLLVNMVYCFGLFYYARKIRKGKNDEISSSFCSIAR